MKPFSYKYLLDTSFFHDVRVEGSLKCDVLPWLLGKAEDLVSKNKQLASYTLECAL